MEESVGVSSNYYKFRRKWRLRLRMRIFIRLQANYVAEGVNKMY